jgi:DNA-binding LacI/PurR family transcriptional regulator
VPPRRRVGIKDVASAAGVSATTVSHALNGKGRLPPGTRERVHRIAEELGYRPNATARHLAGGKTGVLGLAAPRVPARRTRCRTSRTSCSS